MNFPLCKIFFEYLIYDKKPFSYKKNIYVGYVSIFKKNISKIDISRIFDKYGLVLSKVLHKKDSIFTKNPNSTNNIMIYAFFRSRLKISNKKFLEISSELNA